MILWKVTMNITAALSPHLNAGASYEEILAVLGQPNDTGAGLRGFTILAWRDRTVQLTMHRGRLLLLAFYFQTPASVATWLAPFAALADFSAATTPGEVQGWLEKREIEWQLTTLADEQVIKAGAEAGFYFEDGLLSSIQITSTASVRFRT